MLPLILPLLVLVPTAVPAESALSAPAVEALPQTGTDDLSGELSRITDAVLEASESEDVAAAQAAATELLALIDGQMAPALAVDDPEVVAAYHALRGWAMWVLDRIEEADREFALIEPSQARDAGYLDFRHDLALDQEDWPKLLEILETDVAAGGDPETMIVNHYTIDDLEGLRYFLGYSAETNGRVAELLLTSNWGTDRPPGDRDWIYSFAFVRRVTAGDEAGARDVLNRMRAPDYIAELLINPAYAAYHAEIEARHGTDLGESAERLRAALESMWDARSGEARYLLDYMIALRALGRHQEIADRFTPLVDAAQAAMAAGDSEHFLLNADGFFVVDYLAEAEMSLGRNEAAEARMDRLLELGIEEHPALINQGINALDLYFQEGRYGEALARARSLDALDEGIASPYGRAFIWGAAACAAHLQGDADEAAQWRARLTEDPAINAPVVFDTLLCLDDPDAAAAFAIEMLAGDDPVTLLMTFQELRLWRPIGAYDALLQERRDAAFARPDLRRAIAAAGGIRSFALAEFGG
ncbi:tetratricopeptide repeat protein [Parasphingopyxis marina]|uniref:Tetratricopeptide repeat protein n=1 Tax=Parasphingopyxis marina TaxID=2761622 RepID=A0A842HRV8_9SPHN|nr:hypothetical protein [Parasphingopyxis marina]MBC2776558.1 hypothetical protein [Parasphingopyxis marina]